MIPALKAYSNCTTMWLDFDPDDSTLISLTLNTTNKKGIEDERTISV